LVLVKIWLGYAEVKALDKATIENVHCVGNLCAGNAILKICF